MCHWCLVPTAIGNVAHSRSMSFVQSSGCSTASRGSMPMHTRCQKGYAAVDASHDLTAAAHARHTSAHVRSWRGCTVIASRALSSSMWHDGSFSDASAALCPGASASTLRRALR